MLVAMSFLIHATFVEFASSDLPYFGFANFIYGIIKTLGYFLIIINLLTDPLLPKPKTEDLGLGNSVKVVLPPIIVSFAFPGNLFIAFLSLVIAVLYLRRVFLGIESQLKALGFSLLLFSISEVLTALLLTADTNNITLYNLVRPFGIVWILKHGTLLVSSLLIHRWVFNYLFRRITSQIFIIFVSLILTVFVFTVVSFSVILLNNFESESTARLETDVKVLGYAVDSAESTLLSDAEVISQNRDIIDGVSNEDKNLSQVVEDLLLTKKLSYLAVLDKEGKVLARGEDPDRVGDSLSGDPLIQKATQGESSKSIVKKDGAASPIISIHSAAPIRKNGKTIGAVSLGVILDNSFLDGIKKSTGLEASIYAGDLLSATTIKVDGKERFLGIKGDANASQKVLSEGKEYSGRIDIFGIGYFASYLPIKDIKGDVIGMLFAGTPEVNILVAAANSVQNTFTLSIGVVIFAVIIAYFISKNLSDQVS